MKFIHSDFGEYRGFLSSETGFLLQARSLFLCLYLFKGSCKGQELALEGVNYIIYTFIFLNDLSLKFILMQSIILITFTDFNFLYRLF